MSPRRPRIDHKSLEAAATADKTDPEEKANTQGSLFENNEVHTFSYYQLRLKSGQVAVTVLWMRDKNK